METTMCRCCASEGVFKDFRSSFQWMGDEEVYADMLRDCFDVHLATTEVGDGGICEVCITQLRNASNFKKQVLRTEEQFLKYIQNKLFQPNIVKQEAKLDEQTSNDEDNASGDETWEPDFEVPIKAESPDEDKPKKRKCKATPTTSKKAKAESTRQTRAPKTLRNRPLKEEHEDDLSLMMYREQHMSEMKKQWHNLNILLSCSNATPFKERNDAGYMCAYCFKISPNPDMLRTHTHTDHANEKPSYKAGIGMSSFVAFLDIVDLKCTLCDMPMDSLKPLTEHLVNIHGKEYFLNLADYFQPFKLTNEQQINCCLCEEGFHNMKLLMQHMNVHFRNFICTICGAGFVNSFRLNRHETTHLKKKSSFPCRHCGQVFAAESKKKAHVNTEHKGIAGDSVCQICKARFKNYYQKTRHMMQVHNAEGIKCDLCDRKFNLKSNLMLHMRSVHLKERPYECSVCNMGFFIKRHMLGHYMATHTNERKYKCEVCGKAYATQNSKRKHMKKNHGISKNNMMAMPTSMT